MGAPVSSQQWSPNFVAQTLEVLPICLVDDALCWMKPIHADSLRVGLGPRDTPANTVLGVLDRYPLEPVVVHSTSWRHEEGRVILTYVAVVKPPGRLPPDTLVEVHVARAELARGAAMAAPKAIGVDAVLEHALRHLSWLVKEDPVVMQTLAGWRDTLANYEPEPFRALA
ncbi:MAG TPA: hypothetical protein VHQ03_11240 [Candidatus Dormibacteraeota bacterium]|jgi:hypothetical protein|nr:hypothetical protein [Candidatus Dormibacteraeota bacterium]